MSHLKSLGGFKNVRSDFDFEGFKLELDETQFDWGTVYEIEVETVSARAACISSGFYAQQLHSQVPVSKSCLIQSVCTTVC